jgi:Amt family ammonium transporter
LFFGGKILKKPAIIEVCFGLAGAASCFAQEWGLSESLDKVWLFLGASLVFVMQAGFALLETGLTRAKNAVNIMMKNLMDFCIGTIFYWANSHNSA